MIKLEAKLMMASSV